ncbi:hypothetical protein [Aurantibacillus circumpalustris]|uniref:hypothetical protein n=1 Tax=Aurantibacillus circumpalustris TaxID=3036359 RepID=UPI00295AA629|nr:hypothetical protein [Aurantibacillus circumpalustris]
MNKITYVLISLCIFSIVKGQSKEFALHKGNCQLYSGSLYNFGISVRKQNLLLSVYKLDHDLNILDTNFVDIGKDVPESYLESYSDTLHGFLNIYFQKKGNAGNSSSKNNVNILRFNKKFELIAKLENVEIARLNNTSLFTNEVLYAKNAVYTIKTESDTSGTQFYLNKYLLKSETSNFDYEFKWQFPFERKNIHAAHIFYANKNDIFLFVTVSDGIKNGEWQLKINAETGELKKATKLNNKGDDDIYFYGDAYIDKNYKSISFIGQKFTESQFSRKENKLLISKSPQLVIYYIEIDSLGEIKIKEDFKVPINDTKTGVKKTTSNFMLRFSDLRKNPDGKISFTGDIFKSFSSNVCYLYSNTTLFNLIPNEDRLVLERNVISPNLLIEQYFQTLDKLDLNGKLCIDSVKQYELLFYKPLNFPIKQYFKLDQEKNPVWILSKHLTRNNLVNYSFLSPVKKIYKINTIEEIKESTIPLITTISPEIFVISSQIEEVKYQLKLYKW